MTLREALYGHLRDHRRGMAVDLAFATVWVAVTSLTVDVLGGPEWAAWVLMGSGVVAYFGFFWSLAAARDRAPP